MCSLLLLLSSYSRVSLCEPPISLPSFVRDAYHVAEFRRSRLERGRDYFLNASHKPLQSQLLDLQLAGRRDSAPAQQHQPPQLVQHQKLLQQRSRHESMEVEQEENEAPSDIEPSRSAVSNSGSSSRSSSSSGSKRTLGYSEEELKRERAVSKRSRGGASHPLSSRNGDSNGCSNGRRQK